MRANQIRAVDWTNTIKQNGGRCRKVWREQKHLIHAKVCRINENNKYINESTSKWTFGQHKRGFTKLLKAYKREFPHATVRNE